MRKRVPEIARYMLDHEDVWVFNSLTASFTADELFEPSGQDSNIGMLSLPLNTELSINDGQHRRAAIEEALQAEQGAGSRDHQRRPPPPRGL